MYLRLIKHRMSHSPTTRDSRLATRALTLIEMLIGMAITLIMMAAVVSLFANIGSGVRVQRAAMEMSSQLRVTRARLYADLAGATCAPRPKLPSDDHSDGYIEIVEGIYSDKNPSLLLDGIDNATNPELNYATSQVPSAGDPSIIPPALATAAVGAVTNGGGLGDYDDILALTVRSENEPFAGRKGNTTIESDVAEVIWFAVENPATSTLAQPGMRTLYRRVLLIAPWIDLSAIAQPTSANPAQFNTFYKDNDISVRIEKILILDPMGNPTGVNYVWVANTLSDLTKRENRFGHFYNYVPPVNSFSQKKIGFPHVFPHNMPALPTSPIVMAAGQGSSLEPLSGDRLGDDLMLNDLLAFDLRVFDPEAQLVNINNSGVIAEPSDAGWRHVFTTHPISGVGAYVDLNYWGQYVNYDSVVSLAVTPPPIHPAPTVFSDSPHFKSNLATPISVTYDTWSYHYESDGLDQDDTTGDDNVTDFDPLTGAIDEGTDGLDSDGINGVDIGERETSPPYNVPLRGIQVKLRVYEPDTRQIREATVTRGMVPQ